MSPSFKLNNQYYHIVQGYLDKENRAIISVFNIYQASYIFMESLCQRRRGYILKYEQYIIPTYWPRNLNLQDNAGGQPEENNNLPEQPSGSRKYSSLIKRRKKRTVFALALLDKPIEDACESSTPRSRSLIMLTKFFPLLTTYLPLVMNHCFWTEVSVCHSSLCGLALAILVL